jgi:hypothetical protein
LLEAALRTADATSSSILTLSSMEIAVESMLACNITRTIEREQVQGCCTVQHLFMWHGALTLLASAQCVCGGPAISHMQVTTPFVDPCLIPQD